MKEIPPFTGMVECNAHYAQNCCHYIRTGVERRVDRYKKTTTYDQQYNVRTYDSVKDDP